MKQMNCASLKSTHGKPMSLLGVKFSGDLRGLMFEACVEQRFKNSTDQNLEIVYRFPLPWGAVLLNVDVVLGDTHLSGTVVEKKQAEARYEESLSQGDAAIMLVKNDDHSYALNLGNIAAGEECVVTLRYAQVLQFEQGGLRLLIPTVIAPRYGDAIQAGSPILHQSTGHSLLVDYQFELTLKLHGELARSRIASPSHPVSVDVGKSESDSVLTVSLLQKTSLDRDFILNLDRLAQNSMVVAAHDYVDAEKVAILASFCPRLETDNVKPAAIKILVDCSGSMAGDSIAAAKRALQFIIQQLGSEDRFSLSKFGSHFEHRSRALWKSTDASRLAATRWVGDLEADLGGTEMQSALSSTFALAQTIQSDVLLITDGEINGIDRVIDSAKASRHRVFVVGIGSSPAETHLRRLAQATGGACDFVAPGEAVEPAVIRMFARLRSPQVTDLHLAWPTEVKPLWVSPLLASVFDGDTVNVFALLERAPSGDLQFLGKFANDVIPRKIGHATLTPDLHTVGTLSRLGAAARLQDDLNEEWEDAISLAVDYQLVTNETNFLLIHARADHAKATEMPELETVRQMVPAGWAGNGTVNYRSHGNYFESRATPYISSHTPSLNNSATQYAVPAFCRQVPSMQTPNRNAPNNSLRSRLDANLTPFELAGQLRTSPMTVWPSSYDGLKAWGIDQSVTDWLEYAMASLTASENREQEVVEAFLFLMSGRETYESLVQSQGLATAFSLILQRLWGMFASGATPAPADTSNQINALLVKAMTEALSTMTNSTWPDSVFVFE